MGHIQKEYFGPYSSRKSIRKLKTYLATEMSEAKPC